MTSPTLNVDLLLKNLKDGTFFERRKAADDLATLNQSSQQIVIDLISIVQNDTDPKVASAASNALKAPAHKAFLDSRPDLAAKAQSAIHQRPMKDQQVQNQEVRESGSHRGLNYWGFRLFAMGILALVLPAFDMKIRGIPTDSPAWGLALMFIGALLLLTNALHGE